MTDAVVIALIGAGVSIVTAALAMYTAIKVAQTRSAMTVLERNTNSKMDELLRVTGQAEFAKGLKQGAGTAFVGAQGPQGEQGERGPRGPEGASH